MSTAFASIVGAMVAKLGAAPAVSSQVYRARLRPLAQQHSDAVVVRLLSATPSMGAIAGGPVDWVTSVAVECYARTTSTTPDVAVDSLLGAVYAKLMSDTTLGGLCADLFPADAMADFDADGEQTACITLQFEVHHRTSNLILE